jgi:hypothetical protein
MKTRKSKDIQKALTKKGFVLNPDKDHHKYYCLEVNGKTQAIYTYFSHGKDDYGNALMTAMKRQLKFRDTEKAESYFDCPMSKEMYIEMLRENGDLKLDK